MSKFMFEVDFDTFQMLSLVCRLNIEARELLKIQSIL